MNQMMYRTRTLFQYKDLVWDLVARDIKLKYRRSFLGYIWSILNPLLIMIVLAVVFTELLGRDIKNYPVYLLIGRTLYDFMKNSTLKAMTSVTGNAALLKKVYIPKYIFTLSKVTSVMLDLVFSIGALIIVMIATRADFYWHMALIPIVIIQIYIFSLGLGFFLAQFNVFFRDVQHIYNAVLTIWMYVTPIMYSMERLPANLQFVIRWFNPLYFYVQQFRAFAYLGTFPTTHDFVMGWVYAFIMLAFGAWTFQRSKDRFILYI